MLDSLSRWTTPGAVIVAVAEGSAAGEAGLVSGDVVTSFNGTEIESTVDMISATRDSKPGESVELTVVNGVGSHAVTVTLGERFLTQ